MKNGLTGVLCSGINGDLCSGMGAGYYIPNWAINKILGITVFSKKAIN